MVVVTVASTSILVCKICDEPITVKLTFGELEGPFLPVLLRASDVEAAWLEHALAQGDSHA